MQVMKVTNFYTPGKSQNFRLVSSQHQESDTDESDDSKDEIVEEISLWKLPTFLQNILVLDLGQRSTFITID